MTAVAFKRFAMFLGLSLLPMAAMALDEPTVLRLLGHSRIEPPIVTLQESDWRWLR